MNITIYVCGNYDILRDGELIAGVNCETAIEKALEIAYEVSEISIFVDREFSYWRGGKYQRYAVYSTGLICTLDRAPAWVKEVIDNMDYAMREELKQWIQD